MPLTSRRGPACACYNTACALLIAAFIVVAAFPWESRLSSLAALQSLKHTLSVALPWSSTPARCDSPLCVQALLRGASLQHNATSTAPRLAKCLSAPPGQRLYAFRGRAVAVVTSAALNRVAAYPGSEVNEGLPPGTSEGLNPLVQWVAAEYGLLVADEGSQPLSGLSKQWWVASAALTHASGLISSLECACVCTLMLELAQELTGDAATASGAPWASGDCSGAAAAVAFAVAAGASSVVLLTHPWHLYRSAELTFPTDQVTLLSVPETDASGGLVPGGLAAGAGASNHFTARGLVRVQGPGRASLAPDLCSKPVLPSVQWGLCHKAVEWRHGAHTTVAANSFVDGVRLSGDRLLEEVVPLALPPGVAVETLGPFIPREESAPLLAQGDPDEMDSNGVPSAELNALVHRSAAWSLLPYAPSALQLGSRLSALVQAQLQLAGHGGVVLLPPGRTCNVSLSVVAAVEEAAEEYGAVGPLQTRITRAVQQQAGSSGGSAGASAPLPGPQMVAQVLRNLPLSASTAGLSASGALQLFAWTSVLSGAYAMAAATAGQAALDDSVLPGGMSVAATWPVYPTHCYVDHPNIRDIPVMVNFNNFPQQAVAGKEAAVGEVPADWGRTNLALLRKTYSEHSPLLAASTDFSALKPQVELPELGLYGCNGDYERRYGWGGGMIAADCAARLVRKFMGHLGYIVIQDDTLWMPWNTLGHDPHRIWMVSHVHNESDWFVGCNPVRDLSHCLGCYTTESTIGSVSIGRLTPDLTARQIAVKAANTGFLDGLSCDWTDGFYVAGRYGREFANLSSLFGKHKVQIEMAFSTILDTLDVRAEQAQINYMNCMGPRKQADILACFDVVDSLRVLDWMHPVKISDPVLQGLYLGAFNDVRTKGLDVSPNMTWLVRARPKVRLPK